MSGAVGRLLGRLRRARRAERPRLPSRSPSRSPYRLAGGLALPRAKPGLDRPIVDLPLPPELVFPLFGHGGRARAPLVTVGQHVERGETLAPGTLASASGTVVAIEPRPVAHPAGLDVPCVIVETDARAIVEHATRVAARAGEGSARTRGAPGDEPLRATLPALEVLSVERLVACGVAGLGGAGFPSADKLLDARAHPVHTLVVNGAECEPGIACDEALIPVAAEAIVAGAVALAALAGCRRCLFVVESDKRGARAALHEAIAGTGGIELRLIDVPPLYPSGAERLTIRLATGIDVPAGTRPTQHGVLCVNVASARAAHRARLGEPLLSRVVTVAGGRACAPCNARVAFGTPLRHVLETSGQVPRPDSRPGDTRLRVGGPLSGFDVTSDRVPLSATTNRVALEPPRPPTPVSPCIRCAACSDVCPVDLLPQELLRHARADDSPVRTAALERQALAACLECGCCDIVCPSSIPLTETFRHARGQLVDARRRQRDAARAEALYRAREARLARRVAASGIGAGVATAPDPAPTALSNEGAGAGAGAGIGTRRRAEIDTPSGTGSEVGAGESGDAAPETVDPVAAALARVSRRRGKSA